MKISIQTPAGLKPAEANPKIMIGRFFALSELANNAGDPTQAQYLITPEQIRFVTCLDMFRDVCGAAVVVNSSFRQVDYNKKIGGDKNSPHLRALAADIQPVKGISRKDHVVFWISCCWALGLIGAVNLYPESRGYFHLETGSDLVYGYPRCMVRVYKQQDYSDMARIFRGFPVDVKMF